MQQSREQIVETPVSTQDFLEQDDAIRGQNYVCLSFISPEDVIRSKESYFIKEYMKKYTERNEELINGLSALFPDKSDEIRSVKEQYSIYFDNESIVEDYGNFKVDNEVMISAMYSKENNSQSNVRGVKVRGTYETLQEAQHKAEILKRKDGNKFNIYVAQVGCWCPWSANPNEIENAEYSETQLNSMMQEYSKNKENKEIFYNERKQELVERAKQKAQTIVEDPEDVSSQFDIPEDDNSEITKIMEESDAWSMNTYTKETTTTPENKE